MRDPAPSALGLRSVSAAAAIAAAVAFGWSRQDLPENVTPADVRTPSRRAGALDAILRVGDAVRAPRDVAAALLDVAAEPAWRQRALAALGELGAAAGQAAARRLAGDVATLEGIPRVRALLALRRMAPQDPVVARLLRELGTRGDPLTRKAAGY